jgi:hypothetical protein
MSLCHTGIVSGRYSTDGRRDAHPPRTSPSGPAGGAFSSLEPSWRSPITLAKVATWSRYRPILVMDASNEGRQKRAPPRPQRRISRERPSFRSSRTRIRTWARPRTYRHLPLRSVSRTKQVTSTRGRFHRATSPCARIAEDTVSRPVLHACAYPRSNDPASFRRQR